MRYGSIVFALFATILLALALASPAAAQTTVTLIVEWDVNPATDNVITYTATLSAPAGVTAPAPQTVQASAACAATKCQAVFTGVQLGTYGAAVVATNDWGTGPAGTNGISISVPVQVKNVKGKKG